MTQRENTLIHIDGEQLPVVDDTDVVVIGGGPAGLCAAASAARNGMMPPKIVVESASRMGAVGRPTFGRTAKKA